MTDEIKVPEGTQKEQESQEQVVELTPTEQQASKHGWVPQDEWTGPKDEWKSAREFVERGELIGKILAQGRELQELKNAVNFMSEHQKKQYLAGYNNALADLKAKRDAALDEGDIKTATQMGDKIQEVREHQRVAVAEVGKPIVPVQPQPSQTFTNWHQDNSWYGTDKTMTRYADATGIAFKEDNPSSTERQMLDHVNEEVKKQFSAKFQPKSAPNPDGEGRSSGRQGNTQASYSNVEKEMTAEQKQIMNTILKSTPKLTKAEYLKEFMK